MTSIRSAYCSTNWITGVTPFDRQRLQTAAIDEMRRILRNEEPPRPSARLSTMGDGLLTASQKRGVDPRKLTQTLHGELDWIVLRAMEKERSRRYETASAFAADVEHYLKDEQVDACPPSAAYRMRKHFRRNRRLIGTLAFLAMVLVAATVFSAWQAVKANAARRLADERLENEKQAREKTAIAAASTQEIKRFSRKICRPGDSYGEGDNGESGLTVGARPATPGSTSDSRCSHRGSFN